MNNLNEMLSKMTEFLKSEGKTETVIGQQFQLGAFTCVPVMSVCIGLGAGGGEGKGNAKGSSEGEGTGAGGGAGIGMAPMGFLVANGSEIQFIPTRSSKGLSAIFEKAPELIEKLMDKSKEKETA
jgi:uncharacterized spore protein YtfJ